MSTHSIAHKSRINVSYISSLLIAAGLGAGTMLLFDAFFFRTFDTEIAQLTEDMHTKETENIKLSDKVKGFETSFATLEDELAAAEKTANSLRNQVSAKEEEIVEVHQQVEQLSSQKSQIYSDAKTLALCVFDSQVLASSTSNFVSAARAMGTRQAVTFEGPLIVGAVSSFQDSWAHGDCSNAYLIAPNYK